VGLDPPIGLDPPEGGDDWVGVTADPLPAHAVASFLERPDCGGSVVFTGTVRDHAEGRPDVRSLEYEAYEEEVTPRLAAIAAEARGRWPSVGRLALLHRTGVLEVGEASVIAAASAPHREEAFAAALPRLPLPDGHGGLEGVDAEPGGEDWSTCAHPVAEVPRS
jgi:molybdopterin synthase catalytic subunit